MSAALPVEQYSLLWPDGCDPHTDSERQRWGEFTQADLGIQTLAEYLSSDRQHSASILSFLLALTTDCEVIRYRQEVLEDCRQLPDVLQTLESLQPALAEMSRLGGPLPAEQTPLHKTLNRMSELEIYVRCVHTLGEALAARRGQLHSSGLLRLLDFLAEVQSRPVFRQMLKELPELRARYDTIAGISIGVNLDEGLHPVEATILSIHNKPFRQGTFMGKLFGRGSPEDTAGITPLHVLPFKMVIPGAYPVYSATERESQELHPLFADLDRLLRETTRPVAQALTQYVQINTRPLALLADEVLFYINGLRLMHRLSAAGLPVCRPEIIPMEERACELDDFYNVNLASDLASAAEGTDLRQTIVCNIIRFGPEGRIFILTGPNRGGKTVYTQAIGLAQVLFQAGLFVPGSRARISPVDGIYTHFPIEERPGLETGRLGEESARIERIFRCVTRHSLVLLNESLSTTSPGEGLYLARDVVRALRMLGARAIFATHLHELGDVEMINRDTPGDSLAASLVAGSEHVPAEAGGEPSVRRTFRIRPGPPQGLSFAKDIARKYGIELSQLLETLKERKLL